VGRLAYAGLLACGLVAVLPAGAADGSRAFGALQLEPCTLAAPGWPVTVSAQCGTLPVPENRERAGGRTIDLAIAVVPTRSRRPAPDPVLLLAGGPGQSAREAFPVAAAAFAEVLRDRHVVLVDQRGTGGSNPLACPSRTEGPDPAAVTTPRTEAARELAAQCLESLDADVRQYTTSAAVADLEAVRSALGAGQVNLVGVSYGTRVALEYLRRHPSRIRTAVLDGVLPPTLALGSEHARNLEAALDAQFARCVADAACAARYGDPRSTLVALLERLKRAPERVSYRDPVTHDPREDELSSDTVAGVVRLYAYAPQLAALIPFTLAEAAAGRPGTLMAQARMVETLVGEQIQVGLQLSVSCAEDADRLQPDAADAQTLLGAGFVEQLLAQCEVWPRGTRPADFDAPLHSDRPVLLLSGEFDPVTPPRYGEEVVRTLPNGRHLVARGQAHGVLGTGCMPQLLGRFVAAADARTLDATCLDRLRHTPPFTGAYGWGP